MGATLLKSTIGTRTSHGGPPSGLDELTGAVSALTNQSRKRRAGMILELSTDKSESVGGNPRVARK